MLKFWTFHDNPRSSLKLQTWKNDFKWISYIIKHICSYKMWTFGDIECDCKLVLACWCEKSEFFMFLTTCFAFIGHVTVQNYVSWIRWIREIIFLKKLCWAQFSFQEVFLWFSQTFRRPKSLRKTKGKFLEWNCSQNNCVRKMVSHIQRIQST